MKVRIGIGTSAPGLDAVGLCRLGDDIDALGFDSLWLPEVLSAPVSTPWWRWPGLAPTIPP